MQTKSKRWVNAAVAFGLVAAVGAVAMATWALLWTDGPPPSALAETDTGAALAVVWIVAVVEVVAFARTLWSRPPKVVDIADEVERAAAPPVRRTRVAAVFAVISVVVLLVTAGATMLPTKVKLAATFQLPTGRPFATDGAWDLAFVAGVVVAVALSRKARREAAVRLHWVGVVIAVVVVAAVVVGVVVRSADSLHVKHTTAAAAPVPAVPAVLGERRFSIDVERVGSVENPTDQVAAAGPGFVVLERRGVRAYGADGKLRWAYVRTDGRQVEASAMRAFDDGRTVVVRFLDRSAPTPGSLANRVVALDAMTGDVLWQANDFGYGHPLRGGDGALVESRYMLLFGKSDYGVTRIDTRTGRPMWTIDRPRGDGCTARGVDVAGAVAFAVECVADGQATVRLASIDPATGRVMADAEVERFPTDSRNAPSQFEVRRAAGGAIAVRDDRRESYEGDQWRIVQPPPAAPAWTGEPAAFLGEPGPRLLTDESDDSDRRYGVRSSYALRIVPNLLEVCRIPLSSPADDDRSVAWLADEVVVQAYGGIAAFDDTTCAPRRTGAPKSGEYVQLVPAPGLLLAVAQDGSHLIIDGFG